LAIVCSPQKIGIPWYHSPGARFEWKQAVKVTIKMLVKSIRWLKTGMDKGSSGGAGFDENLSERDKKRVN
jgi:hypothetical protein